LPRELGEADAGERCTPSEALVLSTAPTSCSRQGRVGPGFPGAGLLPMSPHRRIECEELRLRSPQRCACRGAHVCCWSGTKFILASEHRYVGQSNRMHQDCKQVPWGDKRERQRKTSRKDTLQAEVRTRISPVMGPVGPSESGVSTYARWLDVAPSHSHIAAFPQPSLY
jgi:hypothetical protein